MPTTHLPSGVTQKSSTGIRHQLFSITSRQWRGAAEERPGATTCTLHGVDPATGRLILNLSLALDAEHSVAKVGYRVVPWRRGHRYAREGLLAVTEWAFSELGLARIQLEHSVTNVASCRVALASCYRMERTLRPAFRTPEDVRHDDHVHGRISLDPGP